MKKTLIFAAVALSLASGAAYARGGVKQAFDFEAMDTDKSGGISAAEVSAFHAARFAEADANGDGQISAEELVTLFPAAQNADDDRREQMLERFLTRNDADDNGTLSLEEITDTDRQARMFERLDEDEDGEITSAEMDAAKADRHENRGGKHGKKERGGSKGRGHGHN